MTQRWCQFISFFGCSHQAKTGKVCDTNFIHTNQQGDERNSRTQPLHEKNPLSIPSQYTTMNTPHNLLSMACSLKMRTCALYQTMKVLYVEDIFQTQNVHTSDSISLFLCKSSGNSLKSWSMACSPPDCWSCWDFSSKDWGTVSPPRSSMAAGRFSDASTLQGNGKDIREHCTFFFPCFFSFAKEILFYVYTEETYKKKKHTTHSAGLFAVERSFYDIAIPLSSHKNVIPRKRSWNLHTEVILLLTCSWAVCSLLACWSPGSPFLLSCSRTRPPHCEQTVAQASQRGLEEKCENYCKNYGLP